ncbi:hypothetical protein I4F81_005717 [Pyropia yezoensis]|uniref:Uncharacterized protein n=1 Tax=Pyropia yezoensis TaxID=2788 RepID=A0ACC3BZ60_PYRYE|nr:hypothetical protein I4F81_005717 [Neopyropia yezoensis]
MLPSRSPTPHKFARHPRQLTPPRHPPAPPSPSQRPTKVQPRISRSPPQPPCHAVLLRSLELLRVELELLPLGSRPLLGLAPPGFATGGSGGCRGGGCASSSRRCTRGARRGGPAPHAPRERR